MNPKPVLDAMLATAIPSGRAGLWEVWRFRVSARAEKVMRASSPTYFAEAGFHTYLSCTTPATAHLKHGEIVMCDNARERKKHLQFALRAWGDVLVTGLGLGCVARGLLANPGVTSVHVVEREQAVIDLVWKHMPLADGRLVLHKADALEYVKNCGAEWDCAWHDCWSDPSRKEEHLVRLHQQLLLELRDRTKMQGAWALPRWLTRVLEPMGVTPP